MPDLSRLSEYIARYGVHLIPAELDNLRRDGSGGLKKGAFEGPGYILSTRMRSGSIWIRSLLYDYEALSQGETISPDLPVWLAHYSPQLEVKNSVRERYLGKTRYSRQIIKSHYTFDQIEPILQDKKILVLFRTPEDTFTEQYRKQTHAGFKPDTNFWTDTTWKDRQNEILEKGPDTYALQRIGAWVKYYQGFLAAYEHGHTLAFVSYESMQQNPHETFARIVKYVDYTVNSEWIDAAIANRDFARVKAAAKSRWDDAMTGSGTVGTGQSLLQEKTLQTVQNRTAPVLKRLRELENGP